MHPERSLRLAFVAGLSDKKLWQKLEPLLLCPQVERVDLFRRAPFRSSGKLRVFGVGRLGRRLPILGEMLRFIRLLWYARRCDVIVGCFQLYHGIMAHLAGKLWGKPVIQLIITDVDWNMARPLARWSMLGSDACGTRGPLSITKLRGHGFAGPVAVIHNPALTAVDDTPALPQFDVIAVGDFAVEKDYPLLVEALALVKQRRGGVLAILCGRGLPGPLAPLLERHGLTGDVNFPGHLCNDALTSAYRSARLFVLSSQVEGLPMVAVEAMALGLPVAATAVGEMSWLVRDGQEGLLAPQGDAEALAGAITEILDDAKRAKAMGISAKARIRELADDFAAPSVATAWERLFAVTCAQGRGRQESG